LRNSSREIVLDARPSKRAMARVLSPRVFEIMMTARSSADR
jgi:hypothetical protein